MRLFTTLLLLFTLLSGWATPRHRYQARGSQPPLIARPLEQIVTPTLNVFPNPSRGPLTVQVAGQPSQPGQEYKLRLSNILGREVRLQPLHSDQAAQGLAVDLTGLPPGLYFYSLLVDNKIVSTKRLTLQSE